MTDKTQQDELGYMVELSREIMNLNQNLEVALEALVRIAGRRVLDDRYTADANDLIVIAQTTLDKIRG